MPQKTVHPDVSSYGTTQTSSSAPAASSGKTATASSGKKNPADMVVEATEAMAKARPVRTGPKVGRNDPCPCGSGRKYKHCCGKNG